MPNTEMDKVHDYGTGRQPRPGNITMPYDRSRRVKVKPRRSPESRAHAMEQQAGEACISIKIKKKMIDGNMVVCGYIDRGYPYMGYTEAPEELITDMDQLSTQASNMIKGISQSI